MGVRKNCCEDGLRVNVPGSDCETATGAISSFITSVSLYREMGYKRSYEMCIYIYTVR